MLSALHSTVSSGVNALAAVIISDIVHPIYKRRKGKRMDDTFSARVTKGLCEYGHNLGLVCMSTT